MTKNPVHWFEIPATNLPRAIQYYETVLGVKLTSQPETPDMAFFPFDHAAPGSPGSLVKAPGYTPASAGTLVYFSVDSIELVIETVKKLGCRVLKPKTSIGPHGFIAFIEDYDGNRVGIHSSK